MIRVGLTDRDIPPRQVSGPGVGRSGETVRGRVSIPSVPEAAEDEATSADELITLPESVGALMQEASLAKRVGGLGKAWADAVDDLSGSVMELESAVTENLDTADDAFKMVVSATDKLTVITKGKPLGRVNRRIIRNVRRITQRIRIFF